MNVFDTVYYDPFSSGVGAHKCSKIWLFVFLDGLHWEKTVQISGSIQPAVNSIYNK